MQSLTRRLLVAGLDTWDDGWQTTLDLIKKQASLMASM